MTNCDQSRRTYREVIGLLPAAGQATRIAPLPFSKELYPVGFGRLNEDGNLRPKVVSQYVLEKMRFANITKAYVILRYGKWDIPAYFGDGKMLDMHLAYLMMNLPFGVPYTLDQAYPFLQDVVVALGFPDIIFEPDDAFARLVTKQAESNADMVLGLFPAHQPHDADMVDLDDDGNIRGIKIKSVRTDLRYAWVIAVWTPIFTQFMHEYLTRLQDGIGQQKTNKKLVGPRELFLGNVIQNALDNHLHIESVYFPDGTYLDIGTPDNLLKAVRDSAVMIS